MTSLLPVWPLQCSSCLRAFIYPRAATLDDAYLQAHIAHWAVALYADGRPDFLQCPRCSNYQIRRTENF
jgi:hypothetical protein